MNKTRSVSPLLVLAITQSERQFAEQMDHSRVAHEARRQRLVEAAAVELQLDEGQTAKLNLTVRPPRWEIADKREAPAPVPAPTPAVEPKGE